MKNRPFDHSGTRRFSVCAWGRNIALLSEDGKSGGCELVSRRPVVSLGWISFAYGQAGFLAVGLVSVKLRRLSQYAIVPGYGPSGEPVLAAMNIWLSALFGVLPARN